MSEHMLYIKNATNVTETLHQNVRNMNKQNIASKRNPDDKLSYEVYEIVCKYVVLHLRIAQYKIPHYTSEIFFFYFEVILVQDPVLCEVVNRYMNFILDLDEEFSFQKPAFLDSNSKHYYQ